MHSLTGNIRFTGGYGSSQTPVELRTRAGSSARSVAACCAAAMMPAATPSAWGAATSCSCPSASSISASSASARGPGLDYGLG